MWRESGSVTMLSIAQLRDETLPTRSTRRDKSASADRLHLPSTHPTARRVTAVRTQSTWNTISPEELISGRKRKDRSVPSQAPVCSSWHIALMSLQLTVHKHRYGPSHQKDTQQLPLETATAVQDPGSRQKRDILSDENKQVFITTGKAAGLSHKSHFWFEANGSCTLSVGFFKGHRTPHIVSDINTKDPTLILTSFGASFFTSLNSLSPKPTQNRKYVV